MRPNLGDALTVTGEYFNRAIRLLSKVGLMLGYTLWAKVFSAEANKLHESLNDLLYSNLEQKRWHFVAELHDFALSEPMKRGASEIDLRIRLVNIAIALKFSDRSNECLAMLHSVDWTASYRDFKLAIAVLEDKYTEAISIMKSIGKSGELIQQSSYHTWPLFTKFREQPGFYEAYELIYNESFTDQIRREADSIAEHSPRSKSRAPQESDTTNVIVEVDATELPGTNPESKSKKSRSQNKPLPRKQQRDNTR
jgi:hypothetical protein